MRGTGSSNRSISVAPVPATSCTIWASEEPPKLHSASPMRAAEVFWGKQMAQLPKGGDL